NSPQTPRAPKTVAVALSISQVLSLPRSTLTITCWLVGLFEARASILGQKSMSSPRVPASWIAAAAAGSASRNALFPSDNAGGVTPAFKPMLMMRLGAHIGWTAWTPAAAGVDGPPPFLLKTWMRLFGRSHT